MDAGLLTREEGDRIMREKGAALRRSFEVGVILDDWYDMLRTKDDTVPVSYTHLRCSKWAGTPALRLQTGPSESGL